MAEKGQGDGKGKAKFSPLKPTPSKTDSGPLRTPKSEAKKNVLKALNDQLKIRAQKLEARKAATPVKAEAVAVAATPQPKSSPALQPKPSPAPAASASPASRIPVSVRKTPKSAKPKSEIRTATITIEPSSSVKNLRERCISRKFLHLWIRKTFGRVLPKDADSFYQRKLVKRAFNDWRDEWWTERIEWRLTVRAQCHDRYRQYRQGWNCWKQYVIMSRIKRAKWELAKARDDRQIVTRALAAWRQYMEVRTGKLRIDRTGMEFHDQNLVQKYWNRWQDQMKEMDYQKEQNSIALQYWSTQTLTNALVQWKNAFREKCMEKRKMEIAVEHRETVLCINALQALRNYARKRQQKANIRANVDRFYNRRLVHNYFAMWSQRRLTKSLIRRRENEIVQSGETFQLRRYFQHWKHYIVLRQEKITKEVMAEIHYRDRLLSVGLRSLQLAVEHTNMQFAHKRQADKFRVKQVLLTAWRAWVACCDQNEEIRTIPQRRRAQQHYETKVVKHSVNQWIVYVQWRRRRREDYIRADARFATQTLNRCLLALYQNAQHCSRKKQMNQTALDTYRTNTLVRFFYEWLDNHKLSRETRTMERMAILHYEDNLVANSFRVWVQATEMANEDHENEEKAQRHYIRKLRLRVLGAWRKYGKCEKEQRQNNRLAIQYHHGNRLRSVFSSWKQKFETIKTESRNMDISVSYHDNRLIRVAMDTWLDHHRHCQRMNYIAGVKLNQKNMETKREIFNHWREAASEFKEERFEEAAADSHYRTRLLSNVMEAWRDWANVRAFKHSRTHGEVLQAQDTLDQSLLKRCFKLWNERHDEALIGRLKWQQAVIHHSRRTARACIQSWRSYVQLQQRKSLLRHQGAWFMTTRLVVTSFVQWKSCYAERTRENEQTGVALWHWSLVLQAKCLFAWAAYARERRRKKLRWRDAMENRVENLQAEALRKWLSTASSLQAIREKWTANEQAKNACHLQNLVRRCAMHWREWARKRSQKRGGAPRVPRDHSFKPLSLLPPRPMAVKSGPVAPSCGPDAKSRIQIKPDISLSPMELARRPKPRMPDFLLASLEASALKNRETKLLQKFDPPCPRLDSADLDQSAPATSVQSHVTEPQPMKGNHSLAAGEPTPTATETKPEAEREKVSRMQQKASPAKPLAFNEKYVLPPLQVSLPPIQTQTTKLTLMTPDMFLNPPKPTQHVTFPQTNQAIGVLGDLTNRMTSYPVDQSETLKQDDDKSAADMTLFTPEEELISIRNRLKTYQNRKSELNLLKSQAKELASWLKVEPDESMQEELNVLKSDIAELTREIEQKRSENEKLVERSRFLMGIFKP